MFRFALYFLFLFSFITYAQEKKQEPDNTSLILHLIANYPLTEDFLLKLEKIERECNLFPKTKNDSIIYNSDVHSSIENYTAYISSKPKLVSILKKYNLAPKDFAAGTLTIQGISMLLTFVPEEEYPAEKSTVYLNNLEFVKKHFHKITTLLECESLIFRN